MKILYFDVETTGTDPHRHGLIQLGQIIEVDGKVISENCWNIQPFKRDEIDSQALQVTNTKREDLFDNTKRLPVEAAWFEIRKTWDQVIDKYDTADKFILAGYNVDAFDQQFLREYIRKCHPMERFSVAGSYMGHLTMDPLPYLKWLKALGTLPIENLKLQTVCDRLGIILTDAHDAMADVRATRWLVKRVRREIQQALDIVVWTEDQDDLEGLSIVYDLSMPMEDEPQAKTVAAETGGAK